MSAPSPRRLARWSSRRRRLLIALGLAAVLFGLGGVGLPAQYGVTSLYVGVLAAFLALVAVVVFVAVPGPGAPEVLLRSTTLAGAALVVAVLLAFSTEAGPLRWLWLLGAAGAAVWTAVALWLGRRDDP